MGTVENLAKGKHGFHIHEVKTGLLHLGIKNQVFCCTAIPVEIIFIRLFYLGYDTR